MAEQIIVALLPCPCCGCLNIQQEITVVDSSARCPACSLKLVIKNPRDGHALDHVATLWNRRTSRSAPTMAEEMARIFEKALASPPSAPTKGE